MNQRALVFTYGQFMNSARMKEFCRHAKALCPATLKHYRLTERLFADIDPDRASEVYGVLYSITMGDKKNLDKYAGSMGFTELEVEVGFGDEKHKAVTYMMTPESKDECNGTPYEGDYIGNCHSGALQHMVPDFFRFANVIVYGPCMSGESDNVFIKNAISIMPCTITGTLYNTGLGYPVFSSEGNTDVDAEFIRVPERIWKDMLPKLEKTPFEAQFLTARMPDGSTLNGWAICKSEIPLPPEAKVIKSGCWRDRHKLKFDTLDFSLTDDQHCAHLLIDFSNDSMCGVIRGVSPGEPEEEVNSRREFGKFWRKEILAALRECHFERWHEKYYSSAFAEPLWYLELNNGEKTVKHVDGRGIFPANWDTFKSVFRLCIGLCRERDILQETGSDREPLANYTEQTSVPEPETATAESDAPAANAESATATPEEARKEATTDLEQELPLFDDDAASAAFSSAPENDGTKPAPDSADRN